MRFIFYCGLAILTGCAVGPTFKSPPPPTTTQYTKTPIPTHTASAPTHGGQAQFLNYNQDVPAEWWHLFHSPAINKLIQQGLANSPSMASGQAILRKAQENLRADLSVLLFPKIDTTLSAERERTTLLSSGIVVTPVPGAPLPVALSSLFNLFNASVSIAYNLDIFGGGRRHVEALRSLVDYQQFELEATYLTLIGNIVTTAINIASIQAQIDVTQEMINNQKHQSQLIENNFKLGHVSRLDVISKEEALKTTEETLPTLKTSLAKKQHALAVLIGALPNEATIPDLTLNNLHLPKQLPVSLPSSLVRQRPDIRSAEAMLHKASAEVGVATANILPQFSLAANYGYDGSILSKLFLPANKVWNYGGQMTFPFFHGAELFARRKAAIAAYDDACSQYRKVVLESFQNVADVLRALEYDAELLQIRNRAQAITRSRLAVIKGEYQLGKINYLRVLEAEQNYENIRIKCIQAQAARYADTAALFQALGGGWWNRT